MSAVAMPTSSLNPNAPLFIPAAFRRVEDFSPEWWELVKTTAWFRDHWFRQHQQLEDECFEVDDIASLLPDDSFDLLDMVDSDDLFYHQEPEAEQQKPSGFGSDVDAVLKTMSLASPKGGAARPCRDQPRYGEKPLQHVSPKSGGRRLIHQPR